MEGGFGAGAFAELLQAAGPGRPAFAGGGKENVFFGKASVVHGGAFAFSLGLSVGLAKGVATSTVAAGAAAATCSGARGAGGGIATMALVEARGGGIAAVAVVGAASFSGQPATFGMVTHGGGAALLTGMHAMLAGGGGIFHPAFGLCLGGAAQASVGEFSGAAVLAFTRLCSTSCLALAAIASIAALLGTPGKPFGWAGLAFSAFTDAVRPSSNASSIEFTVIDGL